MVITGFLSSAVQIALGWGIAFGDWRSPQQPTARMQAPAMEATATNALVASNEMNADTPSDQAVFSDNIVPSNDSLAMAPEQLDLASTLARVRDSFDHLGDLRQGEGGLDSANMSLRNSIEADQFPPLNEIAGLGSGDFIKADVVAGSIVLAPEPVIEASS